MRSSLPKKRRNSLKKKRNTNPRERKSRRSSLSSLPESLSSCTSPTTEKDASRMSSPSFKDFELLCSLGVFNASLMNDAIFKFKRYEDSSLSYTGIEKHTSEDIGGWDTVIRREEYEKLFYNQQATMKNSDAPIPPEPSNTDKSEPVDNKVKTTIKPILKQVNDYTEAMNIDFSKIVVGAKVVHAKFGEGEIVNIDKKDKYLTVRFSVGEKKFINPDAFTKGFLEFGK